MKIIEFTPKNSPLIKARFAGPLRRPASPARFAGAKARRERKRGESESEARAKARRGAGGIKNSINPPTPPLYKGGNTILALGAESAGNFSVFCKGKIYLSENFGDLLDEKNFKKFQKTILNFLKKNKMKPDIILTDLHPLYKTTLWGAELAKKFKAKHVQVQHHIAHIFSAFGEYVISNFQFPISKQIPNSKFQIPNSFLGIALDGTGYGLDGKIWGGEVFQLSIINYQLSIKRIGHLENQVMIGGDLAVKEPARMLIAILAKFPISNFQFPNKSKNKNLKPKKDFIFQFIKPYYTRNQFELLYNQLEQNFNCQETSSTGRILDAVSLLLGFCGNERNYKHEPIELLEKNSTKPYKLPPLIKGDRGIYTLQTTYLFEYLIKNFHRDKKRLASTAQLYIAQGLYKIIKKQRSKEAKKQKIFLAGGISNNKIISSYLESKGIIANKKIPRGDAGLSFGQIIYQLIK